MTPRKFREICWIYYSMDRIVNAIGLENKLTQKDNEKFKQKITLSF